MAPDNISTLKHGLLYGTCQGITGLSIFAILAAINCWFSEQQEITLGFLANVSAAITGCLLFLQALALREKGSTQDERIEAGMEICGIAAGMALAVWGGIALRSLFGCC